MTMTQAGVDAPAPKKITDYQCTRCGKRHLNAPVWLELNSVTTHYVTPGRVPDADSQGAFPFGKTCAHRALAHERLADRLGRKDG